MKVTIESHEWYPVYVVSEDTHQFGTTVDVEAETLKRWKEATEQFEAVQTEIKKHIKK